MYDQLIHEKDAFDRETGFPLSARDRRGLTAAFYLIRLGHSVTIYDANAKAGGVMRYGIPAYRLPKDVLEKEVEFIKKLGVKFVMNTKIGKDKSFDAIEKESDAVYMAVGAYSETSLGIPGEELKGVVQGTEVLYDSLSGKEAKVGKNGGDHRRR